MLFRFSIHMFAFLPLFAALACGCTIPDEHIDGAGQEQITFNSWQFEATKFNALVTNPNALPTLASTALEDAVANPYVDAQLEDPFAQELMDYLVGCALEPGQVLSFTTDAGAPMTFSGALGLCPAWLDAAPDAACLEVVSACILARNNHLGDKVALSLRGLTANGASLGATSNAVGAALVPDSASLAPCAGTETGLDRECGFSVAGVGACTAGSIVTIQGESCTGTMVLRVCEGASACDDADALGAAADACAEPLAIVCPAAEAYTVLVGPYDSSLSGDMDIDTINSIFPAYERDYFDHAEGAFYGNMFSVNALNSQLHVFMSGDNVIYMYGQIPYLLLALQGTPAERRQARQAAHDAFMASHAYTGVVFGAMYSCAAPQWTGAAAYAEARLCATPGTFAHCAAAWVGYCGAPEPNSGAPARLCKTLDNNLVADDGDFDDCADSTGRVWRQPLTTYLH